MRKAMIILVGVILLYLIPSLVLKASYGPSYGFMEGEDRWIPDGQSGWEAHGAPLGPPPDPPSEDVPLWAQYMPIFLPGLLMILLMFTPLSAWIDRRDEEEAQIDEEEDEPTGKDLTG